MMRRAMGAVAMLAGLAVGIAAPASGETRELLRPAPRVPACTYDDGSSRAPVCVWDARHMGNGEGRSFIAVQRRHGDPAIRYVSHRAAHYLAGGAR